jgi:hypothetical protein
LPVIATVALDRFAESTSSTSKPSSTATGPASSTNEAVPALAVSSGASFTHVTVTATGALEPPGASV